MIPYNDKIEAILEKVQKAPRYTGGEMNAVHKDWDAVALRYGFCFPDTYEVGMSHLGLKILYGAGDMNLQIGGVERGYLVDAAHAVYHIIPHSRDVVSDGANHAQTRNYNSSAHVITPFQLTIDD